MARFDGFILFAEMRTGSNHLEESLNLAPGITCHGEAFNPAFVGHSNLDTLCGVTLAERQSDPDRLIAALRRETPGLPGFRFFHNHDARVLDRLLPDPAWAKVILSRDPVESFVSHQIALATDQWRVTDMEDRRHARITFDPAAFADHLAQIEGFQSLLRRQLKVNGQAPYDIAYEDILDLGVLNGLLGFLGVPDRLSAPSARLKRQNPEPLRNKVTNPEVLEATLTALGHGPAPAPDLAPVRANLRVGPGPHLFIAMPGVPLDALPGYDQADPLPPDQLRPWLNRNKGHRVLTAVSHPVARAFRLMRDHGWATDLTAMLEAAKYGTCGDPALRPQADLLAGMAPEVIADEVRRAPDDDLPDLAAHYTSEAEALARDVYNRDYRIFGYGKWRR